MANYLDNAVESLLTKAIKSKITDKDIENTAARVAPKILVAIETSILSSIENKKDSYWVTSFLDRVLDSKELKTAIINNLLKKLN